MTLKKFYGDLPVHEKGSNRGRLNRKEICNNYVITANQLAKAYLNWQDIFRFPESDLTFRQYLDKMKQAKIVPDQVGNSKGQYNLSRIDDVGPYRETTCRFIPRIENIKEQKNLFGGKPGSFQKGNTTHLERKTFGNRYKTVAR